MARMPQLVCHVAFDSKPGQTNVWTDISKYVLDLQISRGKTSDPKSPESRVDPGKITVSLDNKDRRFDPLNSFGPYYNKLLPAKQLAVYLGFNWFSGNSNFEVDTSGWAHLLSGTSPTFERYNISTIPNGYSSWALRARASINNTGWSGGVSTSPRAVASPGVRSRIQLMHKDLVIDPSVNKAFRYCYYDGSGNPLTVPETGQAINYINMPTTLEWEEFSAMLLPAPAGAVSVDLCVFEGSGSSTAVVSDHLIDAVLLTPGDTPRPYREGAGIDFIGDIEGWPQTWEGVENVVRITALDALDFLNTADIPDDFVLAQGPTGTQLNSILDAIGWPAGERQIDTGQTPAVGKTFSSGENALSYAQSLAMTEQGYLYASKTNKIVFLERHKIAQAPYTTIQMKLSNRPDEITSFPYTDVEDPDYSYRTIINDVSVTPPGVDAITVTDTPSITEYRRRSKSYSTLHSNPNDALDMATYIVQIFKDPQAFIEGVTINPQMNDAMWHQVFPRKMGDRIELEIYPPPGSGSVSTVTLSIQSIKIDWKPERFTVQWGLSPPLQVSAGPSVWILGTSTLDVDTYLGF